jgi:enoyl-CoA hydratase/carnithine racemase
VAELEYTVQRHVGCIRINRPAQRNAFTLAMVERWAALLREAEVDPDVRVVVVTGTGESFCAGIDLDDYAAQDHTPLAEKTMLTTRVHQVARAADELSKPYLAAVDGVAVGAGMDMSLMCDMRFAASSARFSEGYVRIGIVPGDGGCYYLPRIVGTAAALRLLWTGEVVGAEQALAMGLVCAVYADGDLMSRVIDFAEQLAAQPPIAVQLIKRAVRQGERHDLRTALDLISSHQAVVTATDDSREAMTAFLERRTGVFVGR